MLPFRLFFSPQEPTQVRKHKIRFFESIAVSGFDGDLGWGSDFRLTSSQGPLEFRPRPRGHWSRSGGRGGGRTSKCWEMVTASSSVHVSNSMIHRVALMSAAE